jgi:AraC-like DNA-binding protein
VRVQENEPSRLQQHPDCRADVAARSVSRPEEGDAVVRKTVDIIARRYAERLSLVDLACEVGVSRYRLSHRFHRFVGMA